MEIRIKGTKVLEHLTLLSREGKDITAQVIGADKFWNPDNERFEMKREEFEWWKDYIYNYREDVSDMHVVAEVTGIDIEEIVERIEDELGSNKESHHEVKQTVLKEIMKEHRERH